MLKNEKLRDGVKQGHGGEVFFFVSMSMCVCVCVASRYIIFKKKVFISHGASNPFIDEG